jgi:hypothetical protein
MMSMFWCSYRGAVLLHGMSHLVVLVLAASTSKEALLAHVKIEALQAPVSKRKNRLAFKT